MLAVITFGSKEYLVEEGDILDIEKLEGSPKGTVKITDIPLLKDQEKTYIGQPLVKGAFVEATILEQDKADKVVVFKFKRKTGYKKTQGHRQSFTRLKITTISPPKEAEKTPASEAQ